MAPKVLVAFSAALMLCLWSSEAMALCHCDAVTSCAAIATANHVIFATIGESHTTHDGVDYVLSIQKTYRGGLPEGFGITIKAKSDECGVAILPEGQEYLLSLHDVVGAFELAKCSYNRAWSLVPPSHKAALEAGNLPDCHSSDSGNATPSSEIDDVTAPSSAIDDVTTPVVVEEEISAEIPAEGSDVIGEADVVDGLKKKTDKTESTSTSTHAEKTTKIPEPTTTIAVENSTIAADKEGSSTAMETETPGKKESEETKTPLAEANGCINGPDNVPDGWTGQGAAENNECNTCICIRGVLACTKRFCRSRVS